MQDEIQRRHQAAINQGRPTYADPATGYQVMTAKTLQDRGYCCGNGCRHCPYQPRHIAKNTKLQDAP